MKKHSTRNKATLLILSSLALTAFAGGVSGGGGGDGYTRFYKTTLGQLTTNTTLNVASPVPFLTLTLGQTEAFLAMHPEFRVGEITLSGTQIDELIATTSEEAN